MPPRGLSHTHSHQSSAALPQHRLGGSTGLDLEQSLQHQDLGSDYLSQHGRRWADEMTGLVVAAARDAALQVRGVDMGRENLQGWGCVL